MQRKINYSVKIMDENVHIIKEYSFKELSVDEMLEKMKLKPEKIGMIIVDNTIVDLDYTIKNNDVILIYEFLAGG